jgi:hypothetical protein
VNVRFDDGKASQFSGVPPESNDSTVVFIQNYQRFLGGLTKAKRVRIEATFFQQGSRVMEFNTAGLDTSKLRAK